MDSKYNQRNKGFHTRVNERIRLPRVLVIDSEGKSMGEVDTYKALEKAREEGLDLVEVSPNTNPPVCKIMDYSKYVYEQKKKTRKSKATKNKDLKEFRFSVVIEQGDIDTRVRRAKEFLQKGHPVKITVTRRGRQPREQMKEVFEKILTNFDGYSTIEPEPKIENNYITLTFKQDGKTENKQNSSKESKDVQPKG
ncbi:translation initiation factor IF-3 [Candidatus Dojkabacteria bacterium]|uniref:Translation initiation factor IF-3 n=1 Tax=Candidatus Dojkabacteria bacterium TaxID=2099670 RepID=A0A847VD68_9BACT|nr:translation initiation factor IF-3 [Candidatus Dojkabacteria bacterium]